MLTPREHEVIQLVAEGKSDRSVADRLDISISTVRFHLQSAFQKIGVHNRTAAARWFLAHVGGGPPGQED